MAVYGIEVIIVVRASSKCWMDHSILKALVIPGYNLRSSKICKMNRKSIIKQCNESEGDDLAKHTERR